MTRQCSVKIKPVLARVPEASANLKSVPTVNAVSAYLRTRLPSDVRLGAVSEPERTIRDRRLLQGAMHERDFEGARLDIGKSHPISFVLRLSSGWELSMVAVANDKRRDITFHINPEYIPIMPVVKEMVVRRMASARNASMPGNDVVEKHRQISSGCLGYTSSDENAMRLITESVDALEGAKIKDTGSIHNDKESAVLSLVENWRGDFLQVVDNIREAGLLVLCAIRDIMVREYKIPFAKEIGAVALYPFSLSHSE